MPAQPTVPSLLFCEPQALVQHNFQALADLFSHVLPQGDFDSRVKNSFLYKGSVFAVGDLVFNHSINSHLIASANFSRHGLSLITLGRSRVTAQEPKLIQTFYEGLLSPPGADLRFETSLEQLTGSLHITFDMARLHRVSLAMQGDAPAVTPPAGDRVMRVALRHGTVDLRHLFLLKTQQIDACGADPTLLLAAGFDDQVYRLLAIALQPEVFLQAHLSRADHSASHRPQLMAAFEDYVEAYFREPITLTQIEMVLGVSARALQYACMKRHGCPPLTYIRNRRLDHARQQLQNRTDVKVASLAAALNFSSQSQFSRYFRERFGLLPSQVKAGG